MATLKQKIAAEEHVRELLARENLPAPDRIEYGFTCIRLFWDRPKVALVVDIDRSDDAAELPGDTDLDKQGTSQIGRRNAKDRSPKKRPN
ncbi:MAG: hypothetical protein JOZ73_00055 [Solirubrobacterales bacterium]|nr:hypothetical protein [Solirubrobacterales bacterium]